MDEDLVQRLFRSISKAVIHKADVLASLKMPEYPPECSRGEFSEIIRCESDPLEPSEILEDELQHIVIEPMQCIVSEIHVGRFHEIPEHQV